MKPMPNLKTLAGRLFKLVFGWYLLLAILVTAIQLGLEYASIKQTIADDLVALGRSFAPGISDTVWTYDKPLLNSLVKGIAQTAIITGVKIEGSNGEIVSADGHIPDTHEEISHGLLAPFQMHEVALWSVALSENHGKRALGKMTLYSDRIVVLERIKYSFLVILVNSMIKAAGLWLIFYWAITWRLSRPLQELSNAVDALNIKADEDDPVLLDYPYNDEIGMLVASLNDMRIRLSASHRELEQRVAERTQELEAANHRLEALSTTDGLTGIANRRRFDEVLANEWNRALRVQEPVALLMLDVDLFKKYNDHYGHQAGDECLRSVAKIFEANSRRSSDLAARYGGEEFALIAANTDATRAVRLAMAICNSIESLGLPHVDSPFGKVTVSIGVAVITPENAEQAEVLVHQADDALYLAKNQGRNRVVLAS
jgi:diguanylate cyclase (GGDEF)-like protein